MVTRVIATVGLMLCVATTAWAQPNVTFDSPFLVRAAAKLKKNDLITILNSGATNQNVCANVYAFQPDGQFLACCTCLVPQNTSRSLAVGNDVLENPKPFPKAAHFQILASLPVGGSCNAAAVGSIVSGLTALKGELSFTPATLSAGQLSGLLTRCGFLHATPHTCPPCEGSL
jgi:hypothetical protein